MNENLNTDQTNQNSQKFWEFQYNHLGVIGYLALIGLANEFCGTTERDINREIGKVSMDIIEPEFAKLDKRNLLELRKYLETRLESLKKLRDLDKFEKSFIENGRSFAENNNIHHEEFLNIGVPLQTLKSANII